MTNKYLDKYKNIKSFVVGISGGIDSAVIAALAKEVSQERGIQLIGRFLPIDTTQEETARALTVGNYFCNDFKRINLIESVNKLCSAAGIYGLDKDEKIRIGNIKARVRMISLYDTAYTNEGIVLSTDNYTEYLLGFWTLHGDVGDFGMIQSLWKTEVYGLSYFLMERLAKNREYDKSDSLLKCAQAMPTDGLGITDNDFDQIFKEYPRDKKPEDIYRLVDEALIRYLSYEKHIDACFSDIIKRHEGTAFKRENPYNLRRNHLI